MADGRHTQQKASGPGSTHPPPDTKWFESTPEFEKFKEGVKRILAVPKAVLDERVKKAKEASVRAGNPKAAGRKKRKKSDA